MRGGRNSASSCSSIGTTSQGISCTTPIAWPVRDLNVKILKFERQRVNRESECTRALNMKKTRRHKPGTDLIATVEAEHGLITTLAQLYMHVERGNVK